MDAKKIRELMLSDEQLRSLNLEMINALCDKEFGKAQRRATEIIYELELRSV